MKEKPYAILCIRRNNMKILNDIKQIPNTTEITKYDMRFGSHIIQVPGYLTKEGYFIPENLLAMITVLSWCYEHQEETGTLFEHFGLKYVNPNVDEVVQKDMLQSKYLDLMYHFLSMCEINNRTGSI